MSTEEYNLTQDEMTLHHHAAMLKNKLEAYHACKSRDEMAWVVEFKIFLKESIDFFFKTIAKPRKPPRTHPLLLSLTEAINMSSVLEDDPRALRGNYYTAPNDLPPLDIHFHGQHASCRECLASQPQEYSAGAINTPLAAPDLDTNVSHPQDHASVALSMPSAAPNLCTNTSQAQECSAAASSATSNMPIREKRRRASMSSVRMVTRSAAKRKAVDHVDTMSSASISKKDAGGDENVIDDLPRTRGRKAARLQENAKGRFATKIGFPKVKGMNGKVGRKWVKKTRLRKNASPSLEVNLNDTWEDEPVPSEES
ncbi:hypothetical protein EI94DRAFT_1710438 [Lactarius quietus]|nr:hypothetical protein EI94DRAFT_1710438 [Lactarius quietus]